MTTIFITAEIDPTTIKKLQQMGHIVNFGGWGQTRQALSEEELIQAMAEAEILVVEVESVTAQVMDAVPRLKVIYACRSLPNNVDLEAATERGIAVFCTPGRNADSVADFTVGLIVCLARNIHRGDQHLRTQGWHVGDEIPYFHFRGPELQRKTLGVVGCGAIGRKVIQRLSGFEMRILIYDPLLTAGDADPYGQLVSLEVLMSESDIVTIHCALTPETRSMIDRALLASMKPTAVLVNTARAAIVDEEALFQAINKKKIAGAALDVFWTEPLPSDSRWLNLENVLLTPHLGGASSDVPAHQGAMLIDDLKSLAEKEISPRLINPSVLKTE